MSAVNTLSELSFVGQSVTHRKFGRGSIKERSGRTLTISFREYGAHTFLYPDAFASHLTADDPSLAQLIEIDLRTVRAERETQASNHQRHLEELTSRLAQERAAERKAKRAAAPRARKTAAKPTPPSP
ncbi:MAG: hypothetical protein PHY12_02250 [Eubacteriales bacterium]|nr:hypothetical protein [Eubacteriales bacterium]